MVPATDSGDEGMIGLRRELPGFLFGVAVGGVFSPELWGGDVEFEFDFDAFGKPHYLALQIAGNFGTDDWDRSVAAAIVGVGYRGYFLPGSFKLTVMSGLQVGYLARIDFSDNIVIRARLTVGVAWFFPSGISAGVEIGGSVGHREDLSLDWSGLSGGGILNGRVTF